MTVRHGSKHFGEERGEPCHRLVQGDWIENSLGESETAVAVGQWAKLTTLLSD
ncbi:hypothetical protein BH23CHL5_BH23CHL5_15750 [soil metagenome]